MEEYFSRLRRFWFPDFNAFLWLLLALPGIYFFQTVIHEGTHGVMAWNENHDFPRVAPFPHLSKTVNPFTGKAVVGGFLNGVTLPDKTVSPLERQSCDPKDPKVARPRLAGWIGWPQVLALLLTMLFGVLFVFAPIRDPLIAFVLRLWYFGACIDFIFNIGKILFGVCNPTQDWARVMIRGDHSFGAFWFVTVLLLLLVLTHFVWVWWSKWGKEELAERTFWDYRWIAFVLCLLSLTAFVWSLALSDDTKIEKGTVFFVIPVIVQLLAAIFHGVYFVLSFRHEDDRTPPDVSQEEN